MVNLDSDDVPDWLRWKPKGPGPYDQPTVPVHWAAGRLVEWHRLTWGAATCLTFYFLIQNLDWITGLETVQVDLARQDNHSTDPEAFTVSVKGVDEFITKVDGNRIWNKYVRPQQEHLWERRGMGSQWRRTVDITRLRKALPMYFRMVEADLKISDILVESPTEAEPTDQEALRKAIHNLQELLTPAPG